MAFCLRKQPFKGVKEKERIESKERSACLSVETLPETLHATSPKLPSFPLSKTSPLKGWPKEVMDIERVLANKEMVFLKKGFIFQGKLLP
jgi:hypothetical protein